MANYILTKTQKGAKYQYQVIDTKTNEIISKRVSAREYVACTANGAYYFGRIDLIGKGDHGRTIKAFEQYSKTHTDFGVRAIYTQKARDLNNIAYLTENK